MWLASGLFGCGDRSGPAGPVLPEVVADSWKRSDWRELPADSAPDPLPKKGVRRIVAASYGGPGALDVTAYELASPAGGLDAVQRWRPAPDTVFFYSGRYFVVVKWQQADRQALRAFVRELEARLKE